MFRCGVCHAAQLFELMTPLRRTKPNSPQTPLEIETSGEIDGHLAVKIHNTNVFTSTSDLCFAARVILNGSPLELKKCGAGGWAPVAVTAISPEVCLIFCFFNFSTPFRSSHALQAYINCSATSTNRPAPSSSWASPHRTSPQRLKKSSRRRTLLANPSFCSRSARALTARCRGVTRCGRPE